MATFSWQPGQAWDPARTEGFTYGGDLYMPGFEDSPWGPQLTGLTRFIGGKQPEPGQTVYTESFDPMTGKPIPGLQVTPLTAYKVDPRGGTFWEAFTGALPMLAPIGAYAMGLGAAGAASAAGDAAGFIGEGVASGIPAWDAAAINAGVPLAGAPATLADLYEPAPPTDMLDIASRPNVPDPYANETSKLLRQQTIAQDTPGGGLANMSGSGAVVPSTAVNTPTSLLDAIKSGNVVDYLKANPETGRALFSAAGALLNTAGGGGSGGSGGYVDSGYRPTISRGGFNANPQARQMPLSPVGLLSTPAQGQAMSGLWRYGLLGG